MGLFLITSGPVAQLKKKVRAQTVVNIIQLWQSRVEIKDYFVAYFDRIAAFEAPYT